MYKIKLIDENQRFSQDKFADYLNKQEEEGWILVTAWNQHYRIWLIFHKSDFNRKKKPKLRYFQQRTYWELSQKFHVPSYIVVVEDEATWIENYHQNNEYRKKLVNPKYRIYEIVGPTIGQIKELLEFDQTGFEVWLEKHV